MRKRDVIVGESYAVDASTTVGPKPPLEATRVRVTSTDCTPTDGPDRAPRVHAVAEYNCPMHQWKAGQALTLRCDWLMSTWDDYETQLSDLLRSAELHQRRCEAMVETLRQHGISADLDLSPLDPYTPGKFALGEPDLRDMLVAALDGSPLAVLYAASGLRHERDRHVFGPASDEARRSYTQLLVHLRQARAQLGLRRMTVRKGPNTSLTQVTVTLGESELGQIARAAGVIGAPQTTTLADRIRAGRL